MQIYIIHSRQQVKRMKDDDRRMEAHPNEELLVKH